MLFAYAGFVCFIHVLLAQQLLYFFLQFFPLVPLAAELLFVDYALRLVKDIS